jgi:hypothetical protein
MRISGATLKAVTILRSANEAYLPPLGSAWRPSGEQLFKPASDFRLAVAIAENTDAFRTR